MKYSKSETINFATQINRPECLKEMNQFISREGCTDTMPCFDNDEVVLDMDCVEHKIASQERRAPNKSMDSACIITNDDASVKEILLVEFRFNYVNMKKLDKRELFGKVTGSESAINNPTNIHNKYIYIFNSNLKQQAIRRFRNMVPSMPNNYIATDIKDLKSLYFS